jgi:hypothetical protein
VCSQQIPSFSHLALGKYHKDCEVLRIVEGKLGSGRGHARIDTCCSKFRPRCCPKLFAAYSVSCVCRMLPLELFSVSKQMYEDASQVFHSNNCFEFQIRSRKRPYFPGILTQKRFSSYTLPALVVDRKDIDSGVREDTSRNGNASFVLSRIILMFLTYLSRSTGTRELGHFSSTRTMI